MNLLPLPKGLATKVSEALLDLDEANTLNTAQIPGLRVSSTNAYGNLDAIEAACAVLGRTAPKQPELALVKVEANKALREYQHAGVTWAVNMLHHTGGALIADDMGLGKTRQALCAAKELIKGTTALTVVVCPAGVREQWVREWQEVIGPVKARIIYASKEAEHISIDDELIVVSYGLIEKVARKTKRAPSVAIFDEFHRVKGRAYGGKGVKRSMELKNLAATCRYRIGLTGTPMWSRLADFYQLLDILWPWRFGKGYDFDVRYGDGQRNQYGFVAKGASNVEEFQKRLSHYMIRRTKEEVAHELPPIIRQVRWIEPNAKASKLFRAFEIGRKSGEAMFAAIEATLEDKVAEAVEVATQLDTFLLVTWMKRHAYELAEKLEKEGKRVTVISGDDSSKKRRAIIDEAVRTRTSIVATIASVAEGVDGIQQLTSHGIFHALSWVPAELQQAEGRLHRIRQTLPVTWTYICMKESADEWILNTVVKRLDTWQKGVAAGKDTNVSAMASSLGQTTSNEAADGLLKMLYESSKGDQ